MARLMGGLSLRNASLCRFFHKILRPCLMALAIGFGSLLSFAQQPKVLAPHKPIPPKVPKSLEQHEPGMPRSMVGGLWMIDANRKASVYLRNGLETSSITVTPSLYLSNGARFRLAPVTLEASGTAVISINDSLSQNGISPWATLSGYVEVEYTWAWDPLCVTVTSADPVHSVIFNSGLQPSVIADLRFHLSKPKVGNMYAVDGMWWKPEAGVTGFVGLSNITAEPVDARVQVSDSESKMLADYAVRISPHGTKIVSLQALEQAATGSTGGLRVLHTGTVEGMLINGGLEDQTTGYSANLAFHYTFTPTPQLATPEIYAELGLMTGEADPMMAFPVGTVFTPFSVARNVSDKQVSVTPSVYWMQGGTARSARLPSFTLLPSETRNIDVPSLLANAGLSGFNGSVNVILEAQGQPRSLLLASGSVDQKNSYVFQVLPRGVQESEAKTISYWSTGNGDDTMVTIWNPADESQDYRYTLFFTGGHYSFPIHLEPRATRVFNISEIIQNQIPDEDGNIIPATVHEGSAKIAGAHADNEEILVALDAGTYNVRKATCSYFCISCDGETLAYAVVSPFAIAKGSTYQLSFTIKWNTGAQFGWNGTWSSSKTSVATVTQNGGLVTGVSPGTATITAIGFGSVYTSSYCGEGPYCPYNSSFQGSGQGNVAPVITSLNPNIAMIGSNNLQVTINGSGFGSAPTVNLPAGFTSSGQGSTDPRIVITVNIGLTATIGSNSITVTAAGQKSNAATFTVTGPAKMIVQSDVIGTTTNNPSAKSRFVTYQVQNTDGTAAASLPIAEAISDTNYNCTQPNPGNLTAHCDGTHHNNSAGIFIDEWGMYTGYTPAGCGVNVTDHWQWCGPVGSNPPAPNPGRTFGTLTGWIHTVDSQINGFKNPPTPIPPNTVILP